MEEIKKAIEQREQSNEFISEINDQFVDDISGHGRYRNSGFRSQMKNMYTLIKEDIKKPLGPEITKPKGMADNTKLENMNKKTEGKSFEDDL